MRHFCTLFGVNLYEARGHDAFWQHVKIDASLISRGGGKKPRNDLKHSFISLNELLAAKNGFVYYLLIRLNLESVLYLTSSARCFCCGGQRHANGMKPHILMQIAVTVCVCMCVRVRARICLCVRACVCVLVSRCVSPCTCRHAAHITSVCMGRTYKSSRFGPRGDDKAIKLYVSHINCFDLFFLSDSWLDGNKGHFTQLERVLKSAKKNMRKWRARKLTVVSVCPLRGQNTPLCSPVFMLCQFFRKTSKKACALISTLCSEGKWNYYTDSTTAVNKMFLCVTNRCRRRADGSAVFIHLQQPTYVAFAIIPLKPIK